MTPEQIALYGSELWVGPVFLLGAIALRFWLEYGPILPCSRRRNREQLAKANAYWTKHWAEKRAAEAAALASGELRLFRCIGCCPRFSAPPQPRPLCPRCGRKDYVESLTPPASGNNRPSSGRNERPPGGP